MRTLSRDALLHIEMISRKRNRQPVRAKFKLSKSGYLLQAKYSAEHHDHNGLKNDQRHHYFGSLFLADRTFTLALTALGFTEPRDRLGVFLDLF